MVWRLQIRAARETDFTHSRKDAAADGATGASAFSKSRGRGEDKEVRAGSSCSVTPRRTNTTRSRQSAAGLELRAAVRALRPYADQPMRCRFGIATGVVIIGDSDRAGPQVVGDTSPPEGEGSPIRSSNRR